MKTCEVRLQGTELTATVEASSLYDAAEQAIQRWSRLWNFDPEALIVVESEGKVWRVDQAKVRAARRPRG